MTIPAPDRTVCALTGEIATPNRVLYYQWCVCGQRLEIRADDGRDDLNDDDYQAISDFDDNHAYCLDDENIQYGDAPRADTIVTSLVKLDDTVAKVDLLATIAQQAITERDQARTERDDAKAELDEAQLQKKAMGALINSLTTSEAMWHSLRDEAMEAAETFRGLYDQVCEERDRAHARVDELADELADLQGQHRWCMT